MPILNSRFRATSLVAALLALHALLSTGCASLQFKTATAADRGGKEISMKEIDQLTNAFADRYATTVGSACTRITVQNPSPIARKAAADFKLIGATAMYDIVTEADPYSQLLDATVVVTLQSMVWIDEGRADLVFGDQADQLVSALRALRVDIWNIAAKAMTQKQLDELANLIWDWRRQNPNIDTVAFVRFGDFAEGRAKQALVDAKNNGGLLASLDDTNAKVDQALVLSERIFYVAKRAPILASWQLESVFAGAAALPEVQGTIKTKDDLAKSADRAIAVVEQIPAKIDDLARRGDVALDLPRALIWQLAGAAIAVIGFWIAALAAYRTYVHRLQSRGRAEGNR
jgi:hypothetical protein